MPKNHIKSTYQGKWSHLCVQHVCVCVYLSLMTNSFTSVVVSVKHSCTGRRSSQVIAALTGHLLFSLATLQMCVCSTTERKTWQQSHNGERNPEQRGKSRVSASPQTKWNWNHEKVRHKTTMKEYWSGEILWVSGVKMTDTSLCLWSQQICRGYRLPRPPPPFHTPQK